MNPDIDSNGLSTAITSVRPSECHLAREEAE
jgi:hypothetical protein